MRLRHTVLALGLVACAPHASRSKSPAAPEPAALPQSADQLLSQLATALAADDDLPLRGLCTASFVAAPAPHSCGGLYDAAHRESWRLDLETTPRGTPPLDDRAVLVLDARPAGHPSEPIRLYADATSAGWRLDGFDSSPAHATAFLAGAVGGTFDPDTLPSSPDLDAMAGDLLALRQHLLDTGKDPAAVLGGALSEAVQALVAMNDPSLRRSRVLVDWRAAALTFESPDGERLHLYVHLGDGAWEVRDHGAGALSPDLLLATGHGPAAP